MPDLVIESILREGFENLKNNPEIIDDVFASLTRPYNSLKYGEKELQRIKDEVLKKDWSFVHSFGEVAANAPCVSIQLLDDTEDRQLAQLEDFQGQIDEQIADPAKLAALVQVTGIQPDSYDQASGTVKVPDSVNLSQIHVNLIYVDSAQVEHVITGGINNTAGSKQFMVAPGSDVDISGTGEIKSGLDFERAEIKGVFSNIQVMLGVHSKEALMTKYMYTLVKYFLLSRKPDLIERCLIVSSYQGSDFTRNLQYEGDVVFHRFLTVSGKVEDSWRGDQVELVDNVEVTTLVPADEADANEIDALEMSIQPSDTDFDC